MVVLPKSIEQLVFIYGLYGTLSLHFSSLCFCPLNALSCFYSDMPVSRRPLLKLEAELMLGKRHINRFAGVKHFKGSSTANEVDLSSPKGPSKVK